MVTTPKKMIAFLKKNGFEIVGQRGSHVKLYNSISKKTTIVPISKKSLPKGTENAILKEAGLK